jgi:hypothetical protein
MTTRYCPRSIPARIVYRIPRYSIRLSFALNWNTRKRPRSAAKLLTRDEARRIARISRSCRSRSENRKFHLCFLTEGCCKLTEAALETECAEFSVRANGSEIVLSASALLKDRSFYGLASSQFVSCRIARTSASGLKACTYTDGTCHEYKV